MRQTLSQYWDGQVAALRKRSLHPVPKGITGVVELEDEYSGIIDVRVWFDSENTLDIYEYVEISESGKPSRKQYSYHLNLGGDRPSYERWDYDPALPAEYQHHINRPGPKGENKHIPSERISLAKVTEECWDLVVAHMQLDEDDNSDAD